MTKKFNGQKEDVERTIKYFIQDGVVVRFNKIGFTTKYYGKSGGLGTFDERLSPMRQASELLEETYPEFGKVYVKKTGMTEFKLKNISELPERFMKNKSKKQTMKKSTQSGSSKNHNRTIKKYNN